MTLGESLVEFERRYLGYREGKGNDTPFGTWIGIPRAAWCDSFQHFCAYSLGLRFVGSQCGDKGDASVGFTIGWHRERGLFGTVPRGPCFVTYDWKGRGDWNDFHIDLYIGEEPKGAMRVIGGNVSDSVVERVISATDRKRVTGYCYLDGVPVVGAPPTPPAGWKVAPWPGRVLALTTPLMTGQDVRTWQARMHKRGWKMGTSGRYRNGVDGTYGLTSDRVCRAFQREKGLVVDGQVGPQTWHFTFAAPVT